MLKQHLNPYTGNREDMVRVQLQVDPKDVLYLRSIYPIKGLETFMLCSLYKNVCTDLRTQGITHFTPENAQHVYETILRYVAPPLPSRQVPGPNDQGGSGSVHKPRKAPKNKSPDDGQGVKG